MTRRVLRVIGGEGAGNLAGLEFRIVDTAGLEEEFGDSMQATHAPAY